MIKQVLSRLFNGEEQEVINWENLNAVPTGDWYDMATGKLCTNKTVVAYLSVITSKPHQIIFMTRIKSGHGYHYHIHDDAKERITCIQGECRINDIKNLNQAQSTTFYPGTKHKVIAKGKQGVDEDYNLSDGVRSGDVELFVEFTYVPKKSYL